MDNKKKGVILMTAAVIITAALVIGIIPLNGSDAAAVTKMDVSYDAESAGGPYAVIDNSGGSLFGVYNVAVTDSSGEHYEKATTSPSIPVVNQVRVELKSALVNGVYDCTFIKTTDPTEVHSGQFVVGNVEISEVSPSAQRIIPNGSGTITASFSADIEIGMFASVNVEYDTALMTVTNTSNAPGQATYTVVANNAPGGCTVSFTLVYNGVVKNTESCTVSVYADATGVNINEGTSGEIAVGGSTTITAKVLPEKADQRVTWTSSDESVATVTDGKITALKTGNATITATSVQDSSLKATYAVTVVPHQYSVSFVVSESGYGTLDKYVVTVSGGTTFTTSENVMTFSNGAAVIATHTASDAQYTYAFGSWSPSSGTVNGNMSITANFTRELNTYALSGTISASGSADGFTVSFGSYTELTGTDGKYSFTDIPYGTYGYISVSKTGYVTESFWISVVENKTINFDMSKEDHYLTLSSVLNNTYRYSVNGGTAENYVAPVKLQYGDAVTITSIPAVGYSFVKWSDSNTSNPRTVTMVSDLTLRSVLDYNQERKSSGQASVEGEIRYDAVLSVNEKEVIKSEWSIDWSSYPSGSYAPVAFEISLTSSSGNAYKPPVTVTISVGQNYNGMSVAVYHVSSYSGEVEQYTATVADGNISVEVNTLSPFMVMLPVSNNGPTPGSFDLDMTNTSIILGFIVLILAIVMLAVVISKKKSQ